MNSGRAELERILLSDDVEKAIREKEDVIFRLIPELKKEKGFDQKSRWHCYDVWGHTVHAVKNSAADAGIRLILLLHDIGKPFSFQEEDGVRHFKGHPEKSAEIAATVLNRLGYSARETDEYCFYIRNHATTITKDMIHDDNTEQYQKLLHIQYCDASAYAPECAKQIAEKLDGIARMLKNHHE